MTIRYSDARPTASDYLDLFVTTGWNTYYRATVDDLDRVLDHSWRTVSAYEDERLIGFGRVLCDGVMHAMIFDLIVHPTSQRQGIGSEILCRLVAECERAGVRDIQLFSAEGKASFYLKHGFSRRPESAPGMERRRGSF